MCEKGKSTTSSSEAAKHQKIAVREKHQWCTDGVKEIMRRRMTRCEKTRVQKRKADEESITRPLIIVLNRGRVVESHDRGDPHPPFVFSRACGLGIEGPLSSRHGNTALSFRAVRGQTHTRTRKKKREARQRKGGGPLFGSILCMRAIS